MQTKSLYQSSIMDSSPTHSRAYGAFAENHVGGNDARGGLGCLVSANVVDNSAAIIVATAKVAAGTQPLPIALPSRSTTSSSEHDALLRDTSNDSTTNKTTPRFSSTAHGSIKPMISALGLASASSAMPAFSTNATQPHHAMGTSPTVPRHDEGYASWEEPSPFTARIAVDSDPHDQQNLGDSVSTTPSDAFSPVDSSNDWNSIHSNTAPEMPIPIDVPTPRASPMLIPMRDAHLGAARHCAKIPRRFVADVGTAQSAYYATSSTAAIHDTISTQCDGAIFDFQAIQTTSNVTTGPNALPSVASGTALKSPSSTTSDVTSRFLPELLRIVLKFVRRQADSPQESQRTLLSACLVSRHWYKNGISTLWEQPVLTTETSICRFVRACTPLAISQISTVASANSSNSLGIHVRKLDLGRVRLHESVHAAMLRNIASCCTHMRGIRIWCEGLSIDSILHLATASPYLNTLAIAGHLSAWIDVDETIAASLARVFSRLRVLHIDVGFDGDSSRTRLARLVTGSIGRSIRQLRVTGADDDATILSLCTRCPNLDTMLYSWSNISEASIHNIASHLGKLSVIDLRGCQKAVTPAA
eukprot:jgi/Hompol1/1925/HPOL_002846-RA